MIINTKYADAHNYSLRFYVDEDVPFIACHGKNALMGELRKVTLPQFDQNYALSFSRNEKDVLTRELSKVQSLLLLFAF